MGVVKSCQPFNSHISLEVSCEDFMLDQDDNFYLISLSILVTCLSDNIWILLGDNTC